MISKSEAKHTKLTFPSNLITRSDVSRLVRELEHLADVLQGQRVRGETETKLPPLSQSTTDFLELNEVKITNEKSLETVRQKINTIEDRLPAVHMTFASEIDSESLQQLVTWLRTEIHPQVLINTSIQPNLIGGVYLRTPDHVHDFSIKTLLMGQRQLIVKQLKGL